MDTSSPVIARNRETLRYWDGEAFRARSPRQARLLEGMALISVRYSFERAEFLHPGEALGRPGMTSV